MANDMFLEITGIKGESTDAQHVGQIDIMGWHGGATNSGSFRQGPGGGSGITSVGDLAVAKYMDAASTELLKACMTGRHIDSAKLYVRKAGGKPLEFLVITLTKLLVKSVTQGMIEADGRLSERVTLHYAEIKEEYTTQTATGGKGDHYMMSYKVTRDDPNAASPGALPFFLLSKKPNPAAQITWMIDRSSAQQHATPWLDITKADNPASWAGLPGFEPAAAGSLMDLAQRIRSEAPSGQTMFRVEGVSLQGREYLSRYKTDVEVNKQPVRLCEFLPTGYTRRNLVGMRVAYAVKQEAGKTPNSEGSATVTAGTPRFYDSDSGTWKELNGSNWRGSNNGSGEYVGSSQEVGHRRTMEEYQYAQANSFANRAAWDPGYGRSVQVPDMSYLSRGAKLIENSTLVALSVSSGGLIAGGAAWKIGADAVAATRIAYPIVANNIVSMQLDLISNAPWLVPLTAKGLDMFSRNPPGARPSMPSEILKKIDAINRE